MMGFWTLCCQRGIEINADRELKNGCCILWGRKSEAVKVGMLRTLIAAGVRSPIECVAFQSCHSAHSKPLTVRGKLGFGVTNPDRGFYL